MSTLKRCPFCGSYTGAHVHVFDLPETKNVYYVRCESCEATGPYALTESEAIARWQIRPDHRVIQAKTFIKKFIRENKQ